MVRRGLVLLILFLLPVPAQAAGYVVKPGDTLGTISQRFHVSVRVLARVIGLELARLAQAKRAVYEFP